MRYCNNINKVMFIALCLFCCKVSLAAEPQAGLSGKYKGCNVVLIILDALRPDHLSCYGYNKETSPNIDKLAKEGVVFTNAFAQASCTLPSVTSIFTSVYPYSHGVKDVLKDKMPKKLETLAQVLSAYGYRTFWSGMLGDFHSGSAEGQLKGFSDKSDLPMEEGFEKTGQFKSIFDWLRSHQKEPFFLTVHSYMAHEHFFPFVRYDNKFLQDIPKEFLDLIDSIEKKRWFKLQEMLKDDSGAINEELGKDWIKNNRAYLMRPYSQGVFNKLGDLAETWKQKVAISNVGSDVSYHLLESFSEKQLENFLALLDSAIYKFDKEIMGRLINQLKDENLLDKTLIIISADHGNEYKDHGSFFHGVWLYDEVMKVPLIMYIPGLKKETVINELVQGIDIVPTTLDLLGIDVPHQAQGISLVGLIEGRKKARKNKYVYSMAVPEGSIAIRSKEWKLFLKRQESGKIEERLFDLRKDPREFDNICKENPKVEKQLKNRLESWKKNLVVYKDEESEFAPGVSEETKERIKKTGYW